MFRQSLTVKSILLNVCLTVWVMGLVSASVNVRAKSQEQSDRQRAIELYDAQNFVAAVPLLEKLAAANPNDIFILSRLGFAVYASSATEKDPAVRQKMRARARAVEDRRDAIGHLVAHGFPGSS